MQLQIFTSGENRVQRRVLKNNADFAPDLCRMFRDIKARDDAPAGCGANDGAEHPDGCGLARAVGAQQSEDFAFFNIQINAAHGLDFAERFRQGSGFNDSHIIKNPVILSLFKIYCARPEIIKARPGVQYFRQSNIDQRDICRSGAAAR